MSNHQAYKITKGIPWQVLDEAVIILSPANRMAHELDETGSFVWLEISKNQTIDQISRRLTEEFDVDMVTAQKDTLSFICALEGKNLVERV